MERERKERWQYKKNAEGAIEQTCGRKEKRIKKSECSGRKQFESVGKRREKIKKQRQRKNKKGWGATEPKRDIQKR